MSTIPAFQSGLAGYQSGMQSLNRNAAKIASAETLQSGGNITEPLVNMIRDEHQIKASAKVIEASSTMMGTLLDIKV